MQQFLSPNSALLSWVLEEALQRKCVTLPLCYLDMTCTIILAQSIHVFKQGVHVNKNNCAELVTSLQVDINEYENCLGNGNVYVCLSSLLMPLCYSSTVSSSRTRHVCVCHACMHTYISSYVLGS